MIFNNPSSVVEDNNGVDLTVASPATQTYIDNAVTAKPQSFGDVSASVMKNADVSLANNTTFLVSFDTELYDTHDFHSNITNTDRITIPSGQGGIYQIRGRTTFQSSGSAGVFIMFLAVNGSFVAAEMTSVNSAGGFIPRQVSWAFPLAAGDYVQMYVYQNTGSAKLTYGQSGAGHYGTGLIVRRIS